MELTAKAEQVRREAVNQTQRRVYIPKSWELPDAIWNRLGPEPGRQRLMDEEGHLLLILHAVPNAADDEIRTAGLFWQKPDGTWKSSPQPGGLAAMEEHLQAYREKIHGLDSELEKAMGPKKYFAIMHLFPERTFFLILNTKRERGEEQKNAISFFKARGKAEITGADRTNGIPNLLARARDKGREKKARS